MPKEEGQQYAEDIDALFVETSALTAENVETIFVNIGKTIVKTLCINEGILGWKFFSEY